MPTNKTLGVAIPKCFYCNEGKGVIMNTRLTEKNAKAIEAMHGHVVDMEPCSKCAGYMKQGIILIGIDEGLSDTTGGVEGFYRSGEWLVVMERMVRDIFPSVAKDIIKHRWSFVEQSIAKEILAQGKKRNEDEKNTSALVDSSGNPLPSS